ncbi:hypothetical protein DICVIV_00371 [Dictyocaulus viviparus]|uniref:G-protein coupled receptors family 1 profile domain-containing protein n=1 Tax=Dictyocaulus viviparus TaxID=29172 RepID=A0A0D8Y9B7_DICVI|nr:hypothetical protein DICVIV_00371 [Dictyocaulus viviparus]
MYATIERVQVFRSPFRTSRRSVSPRFLVTIAFIVIAALMITAPRFMPPSKNFPHHLARTLLLLHAVSVVLVPLVVCALLNILLVLALKKNTMPIQMLKDSQTQQTLLMARNKTERKITIMVTVIITSFIICNAPGAIICVVYQSRINLKKSLTNVMIDSISNTLVLNFVLFCMSSDHFRTLLRIQLISALECSKTTARVRLISKAMSCDTIQILKNSDS